MIAFDVKNIAAGKNIMLMMFRADGNHCQIQLDESLSIKALSTMADLVIILI